jgi:hypothetical protein
MTTLPVKPPLGVMVTVEVLLEPGATVTAVPVKEKLGLGMAVTVTGSVLLPAR